MAKILPIHRTITHINILHTQSKALNNELTKPARPTKRPKETLNTHIDTYSIIPTLTYNVKFSKAWKNAPITPPPPIKDTSTTPLPTKYNHLHPLKFQPQQYIYTGGSFIPPSTNPKDRIEGNTA